MNEYLDLAPIQFHILFALSMVSSSVSMQGLKNVNRNDPFGPSIYNSNVIYGTLLLTNVWNVYYSTILIWIGCVLVGVAYGFMNGLFLFFEYGLFSWVLAGILERMIGRRLMGYSQFWKTFFLPIDFYFVYILAKLIWDGF